MIRKELELVKKYWRIYLLITVTIISLLVIFSPVTPVPDIGAVSNDDGQNRTPSFVESNTGIQFSIELGGGTRIRAPLAGTTAEGVEVKNDSTGVLEESVAEKLNNTESTDVSVREEDSDVYSLEITTRSATVQDVEEILDNMNISYQNVRKGVTSETRSEAVRSLQTRIDTAGLSGGVVRQVELQDGTNLVLVEVPNLDRQETIDLITRRGEVRIDIYRFDAEKGKYETIEGVLTNEDFRNIGSADRPGQGINSPHIDVTVESSSAERFQDVAVSSGVASPGGTRCTYDINPNETSPCLLTVVDDEVVYSAGMTASLAQSMIDGDWSLSQSFVLQANNMSEARDLEENLQSGGLPAPIDIESGEVSFVAPEQGEEFRLVATLIALVSTLAVALTVSLRYGDIKIALPMVLTAFIEVIILISIAVVLRYPVDVAVIAGFVAVIGTGVDDLIIIADRVIGGENPASSKRIFSRRFRKAIWIIMSAAGTTILALGPLAILNLRALQGFAIFTIIGVIAGVILTRPAYGDILRILFTDK